MSNKMDIERPDPLGHFELILLTAIMSLEGESYGVPIYDEVCALSEKRINQGALYSTLDRMEDKGLLVSRLSDPAKEPRGKPKRYYRLTPLGFCALEGSLENAERFKEIFDNKSRSVRRWLTKLPKLPRKLRLQGSSPK